MGNNEKLLEKAQKLKERVDGYRWYHIIKVMDGLYTNSCLPDKSIKWFQTMWDFDLECMKNVDFKNKKVLDIGCRDGLFSFEAERQGAKEIIGIDNDISRGAVEILIPLFKSKVQMHELNLYDLNPEKFGCFDVIMCLGILYHLRYPFWGLKKISDCLSDGGILLLECGMLANEFLEDTPFLYCPTEDSPYETTSCTFFNKKGLITTMRSLNFVLVDNWTIEYAEQTSHVSFLQAAKKCIIYWAKKAQFIYKWDITNCHTNRQFFIFRKEKRTLSDKRWGFSSSDIENYWNKTHNIHSTKR